MNAITHSDTGLPGPPPATSTVAANTTPPETAAAPRRRFWSLQRPELSLEVLALLASLYFSIACNGAFWDAATIALPLGHHALTLASLFVGITALHLGLLCVLLNRWTAKPLLTALLVVSALTAHFSSEYQVYFDADMLRNVLHTQVQESSELLTPSLFLDVLLRAGPPVLLLWSVRLRRRRWQVALPVRLGTFVVAVLAGVLAIGLSFADIAALMRNHKEMRYLIAPGNVVAALGAAFNDDVGDRSATRAIVAPDAHLAAGAAGRRPRLLLLVVGETVRAQNWGLNGYARQTTPELAATPGVLNFPDMSACGSSTEVSLPCMFSIRGRRDYDRDEIQHSESLLHVLARAGVGTLWRDNQTGCKGVCEGLPYESVLHAGDRQWCNDERCLDEVLLAGLGQTLQGRSGDRIVVLHQLGNHGPAYYSRYPDEYARWQPACTTPDLGECNRVDIVNAYDNAVLYTDHFLAEAIRRLQAEDAYDTALLYVSDHGESLGESGLYLHGVPYAIAPDVQLKVPMLAWLSPGWRESRGLDAACLQAATRKPASHDDLFATVLGLLQVRTTAYDPARDVFAACG